MGCGSSSTAAAVQPAGTEPGKRIEPAVKAPPASAAYAANGTSAPVKHVDLVTSSAPAHVPGTVPDKNETPAAPVKRIEPAPAGKGKSNAPAPEQAHESKQRAFPFLMIEDADKASRRSNDGNTYTSFVQLGSLIRDETTGSYRLELDGAPKPLESQFAASGRGSELSDLALLDDRLFTVCDRTGIVYQIISDCLIPRFILADADGEGPAATNGFKGEWMAVCDGKMYIGGHGRPWTDTGPGGEAKQRDRMQWVKTIDSHGSIAHVSWAKNFDAMLAKAVPSPTGYITHESARYDAVNKQWLFIPRKSSSQPWEDARDEKNGTDLMITCSATFDNITVQHVGSLTAERGCSGFDFIPATNDILMTKTVEIGDTVETYAAIINRKTGATVLPETLIAKKKYEGVLLFESAEHFKRVWTNNTPPHRPTDTELKYSAPGLLPPAAAVASDSKALSPPAAGSYFLVMIEDADKLAKLVGQTEKFASELVGVKLIRDAAGNYSALAVNEDQLPPLPDVIRNALPVVPPILDRIAVMQSGYEFAQRGMELSDLTVWRGGLFSVCDRTGILYQIRDKFLIPRAILSDMDGESKSGFKAEWGTVRDGAFVLGSHGRRWEGAANPQQEARMQYVKIIGPSGSEIKHVNWASVFNKLVSKVTDAKSAYLTHESCRFDPVQRQWLFLPRKFSELPFDDERDETCCSNLFITCSEDFSAIQVQKIGAVQPTRGFSAFELIPGTTHIAALRTVEAGKSVQTYLMVFDQVTGKVLMEDRLLSPTKKYEGLALFSDRKAFEIALQAKVTF